MAEAVCAETARDTFLPELEQLVGTTLETLEEQPDQKWLEFLVDKSSNSPAILFH